MVSRSLCLVTLSVLGVAAGCAGATSSVPTSSPSRPLGTGSAASAPVPKVDLASLLDDPGSTPSTAGAKRAHDNGPEASAEARGWLGVALRSTEKGEPGVLVQSVLRGSPAEGAGLEPGDVVLSVESKPVSSPSELVALIASRGAGNRASLMLKRHDQHKILAVPLGRDPGPEGRLRLGYVDAPAPAFEGLSVVQGNVQPELEALRGRVVVLEFWASWCVACRALLPALNDLHARYPDRAAVIGVTMDPVDKAQSDAHQLGMRYAILSDPDGNASQSYQAYALPTVFVIDRAGIVRDVFVGYDPDSVRRLTATFERLVNEPG